MVRDLAAHAHDSCELVFIEQEAQAARIVGDDGITVADEFAHHRGADAAVGAGDEIAVNGAHAAAGISWSGISSASRTALARSMCSWPPPIATAACPGKRPSIRSSRS